MLLGSLTLSAKVIHPMHPTVSPIDKRTADGSVKTKLLDLLRVPEALLVGGFGGVILFGAVILALPVSGRVTFLDALFTSTSAVCVTGLVVVDTATAYTLFGKTVIMMLIQVGGLGIMTFAGFFFQLFGKRLSIKSKMVLEGSFFQQDIGIEFRQMFRQILVITALAELAGTVLIFISLLWRSTAVPQALYSALFHSVSAFCNAGFSIYSDNLVGVRNSSIIMGTVMALIVIGGLGHIVLRELWGRAKNCFARKSSMGRARFLSFHSRIVLAVTAILIVSGTLGLLLFGLTHREVTLTEKLSGALFQSVTARTAGFNTVDIGRLPLASLLLIVLLMFVGGSPASCAGGIKTTALAVFLADLRAKLRGDPEVRLFNRRVPEDTVKRINLLLGLATIWNLAGLFLLLVLESGKGMGFHDLLFEQISAFGTVGLSTGVTDKLSALGKLWIIVTMFMGRLGPLTLAVWVLPKKSVRIQYPEGRVLIG